MRKFLRFKVLAAAALVVLVVLAGGFYWALRRVPQFYQAALEVPPEVQRTASDQMLSQATTLVNAAQRPGNWEAAFTDEQINGWLAVDLIENHPKALPPEIRDPRVAITAQNVQLAWQVVAEKYSGIVSLSVDLELVEPNVVSVRIRNARAGAVPLPLDKILDAIRGSARDARIPLRWMQVDGDPVAIITLEDGADTPLARRIEHLRLEQGAIHLSGTSQPRKTSVAPAPPPPHQAGVQPKLQR